MAGGLATDRRGTAGPGTDERSGIIDHDSPSGRSESGLDDQASADDLARRTVAAVLAGDRDAFRVLVDRESAGVIRVCRRILGDVSEAEDAAQEAFIAAFRSLGTWRGDGPFGAWLTRIAVRLAVRRAAARRSPVRWIQPGEATRLDGDLVEAARGAPGRDLDALTASAASSRSNDPAAMMLAAERRSTVRRALGRLPEPYREVVALRFFGELSLAEIAAQRGTPLGTVKTHLRRGLARLHDTFDREGIER